MKVESYQLLDIAKNVLIQLGVHDYENVKLTYVMKDGQSWRVNFSYNEKYSSFIKQGCFEVNAVSGEITGMWAYRVWT